MFKQFLWGVGKRYESVDALFIKVDNLEDGREEEEKEKIRSKK